MFYLSNLRRNGSLLIMTSHPHLVSKKDAEKESWKYSRVYFPANMEKIQDRAMQEGNIDIKGSEQQENETGT